MDTDIVYLLLSGNTTAFFAARSKERCFAIRVHDGKNSLYVTFNKDSLSRFNFRPCLSTQPDRGQHIKHPLVGAELLITIPASDIYGCFSSDTQVQWKGTGPIWLLSQVKTYEEKCEYLLCLKALHVEFVRFSPLPRHCFDDLIAPLYTTTFWTVD